MESSAYKSWREDLYAGRNATFNYATMHGASPDTETAVLVSLQTAYAAWRGRRELLHVLDRLPRHAPQGYVR